MKKKLLSLVLCFSLLSSLTVSASADFTSSDSSNLQKILNQLELSATSGTVSNYLKLIYNQLTEIRSELDYPAGGFSSLRALLNAMYNKIGSGGSSPNYSTVLNNIKNNTDSLVSSASAISGDTNSISQRSTEILYKLNDVYLRLGTLQTAVTDHIDSASELNHSDWTNFFTGATVPWTVYVSPDDPAHLVGTVSLPATFGFIGASLLYDHLSSASGEWTLYHRVKQLQEVLASDDDLALKRDNKANEEAATSGFVSGSSSKTSLGAGDFGDLKDIGGTFNDLSSLNGQAKISSFSSGLSSADSAGRGWFSEATRASLDAVTPSNSSRSLSPALSRVYGTYRGERSSIYSVSADVSVFPASSYVEPVFSSASPDDDPYNMGTFTDNYSWLWGG